MSACEKCWADAANAQEYRRLVAERKCTPEEQAGPDAATCPECGRRTLHQYTGQPMCGCVVCL